MMENYKSDFYVTFNSNDGGQIYGDNTASNFKIQLPNAFQLAEGYHCALMELHFPSDFYNIHSSELEFTHLVGRNYNEGVDLDNLSPISVITFDNNPIKFIDNLSIFINKYSIDKVITFKLDDTKTSLNIELNSAYRIIMHNANNDFYKALFGMDKVIQSHKASKLLVVNYYDPDEMESVNANSVLIFPSVEVNTTLKWSVDISTLENLFTQSFNGIPQTVAIVKSKVVLSRAYKSINNLNPTDIKIPLQNYSSVKSLIESVNVALQNKNISGVSFSLDSSGYVTANVSAKDTILLYKDGFVASLGKIFGFTEDQFRKGINGIALKAQNKMVLPEINTFYIYSDVVIDSAVGNHSGSLLRILSSLEDKNKQKIIQRNFGKPHYIKCSNNFINFVEIVIKSERNNIVEFAKNTITTVVLHFKYACPENGK